MVRAPVSKKKKFLQVHDTRHPQPRTTPKSRQVSFCTASVSFDFAFVKFTDFFLPLECILWYVPSDRDLRREPCPFTACSRTPANEYEKYTLGPDGKRIYTLKKVVDGKVSKSA